MKLISEGTFGKYLKIKILEYVEAFFRPSTHKNEVVKEFQDNIYNIYTYMYVNTECPRIYRKSVLHLLKYSIV